MLDALKNKIFRVIWTKCWCIGFVEGGIPSILEHDTYNVKWVKMPKDRWFADPFILDVNPDEIHLLVEDFEYSKNKGVISLLKIDRHSMRICKRKVLLELPTHLSFPNILRKDGEIFVYPENCQGGKLILYRYDSNLEQLVSYKTICEDAIWDSVITTDFGEPLLFTANKDDYHLDIYKLSEGKFSFAYSIASKEKNSRMGGCLFSYQGKYYYPAQNCKNGYGEAIDVKEVIFKDSEVVIGDVFKQIRSPHTTMNLGFHTLNEYKNIAVVDVCGYKNRKIVSIILYLSTFKKRIL